MNNRKKRISVIAVIGGIFLALVLVLGTMIMGQQARNDTEKAVRNVSLLYLDELAGRRERVIADNLKDKITVIQTALDLMTEDDLPPPAFRGILISIRWISGTCQGRRFSSGISRFPIRK